MLSRILKYEELLDCDIESLMVGKVTFIKAFGPWVVGQRVDTIKINYENGLMEEWSNGGTIIKSCVVELIPCTS